jgi:hypothetical protein
MPDDPRLVTVSEIARALGRSRARVVELLEDTPEKGQKLVRDRKYAAAWSTADFPPKLRERLARLARNAGCRTIADFILLKCAPWKPELPLAEICEAQIQSATLRRAILAPLLLKRDKSLSQRQLAVLAADAFLNQAPEIYVADRTMRGWIARAFERDDSREEWERIELYLDEKLRRRANTDAGNCQPLEFGSWEQCCFYLDSQIAAGVPFKTAMPELRKRIKGTALVGSLDAHGIWVALDRAWQCWKNEGRIEDKRKGNSGRRAKFELSDEEKRALRFLVLQKESFALAVEEFARHPVCSRGTAHLILAELDRAAHEQREPRWPKSFYRAGHVSEEEKALFRGRKAFEKIEMCERRGMFWRDAASEEIPMLPNTIWESDDMSINEPFRYRDSETGELRLGRQTLCTLDVYSCAWLGVSPIGRPRDAYRNEDIADHLFECVSDYGLPLIWKFERGPWENSVIDGIVIGKDAEGKDIRWGSLDAVCKIQRVFKAKGKGTIESSFNLLQRLLAHNSTTIGRTRGEFERATKAFLRACNGDERCAQKFWDITDAADGIKAAMDKFNLRPKRRHGFGRKVTVPQDLYHGALVRPCPRDELWRFNPIKRRATVRRGHIQISVNHYPNPFRFRVIGETGEHYFENGYNVLIAFHPGRPQDGCHVFNAEQSTRNRDNIPFGEKLLIAPMSEDAPQISLATRKMCNPVVRLEYRAIANMGGRGRRISEARDGRGNSIRRLQGSARAVQQADAAFSRTEVGSELIRCAQHARKTQSSDEAAELEELRRSENEYFQSVGVIHGL